MSYYMSRYTPPFWYTFEFIVVISLFCILFVFWKRRGDKSSLIVYTITGIAHSIVELVGQGIAVREISNMKLFNLWEVNYPFTALIMGFFEGGMFCLIAYHIIRILINKDKFSVKFVIIHSIIMVIALVTLILTMNLSDLTPSKRAIFSPISLILLSSFYLITIGYFVLRKNIPSIYKKGILGFIIGMIYITFLFSLIPHVLGIRFIEICNGSACVDASLLDQIIIMYVYGMGIGAAGYFLPYYIILYHFNWLDLDQK